MKKIKRPRKYFAPQNEGTERKCDHPGCEKAGEYRAPKDRKLKDYYWFCLEHVQEYNAQWNYYAGEIPEEDEGPKARMHFKGFRSKVRYKHGYSFKDDFGFFGEYATDYSAIDDEIMYNAEERKCLEIMELKISEVSLESLKRQYKNWQKISPGYQSGRQRRRRKIQTAHECIQSAVGQTFLILKSFFFVRTVHQLFHGRFERKVFKQDFVDHFANRHFNPQLACQFQHGFGGVQAFDGPGVFRNYFCASPQVPTA